MSRACDAEDAAGKQCTGKPMMKEKQSRTRGHSYFIACSGWQTDFKDGHRTRSILDEVNEDLLVKLMKGEPLSSHTNVVMDTALCSRIISPRIGLKQQHCPHPHIIKGRGDVRVQIIRHECHVKRTIYVPFDESLRIALIIHLGNLPHNHLMPPMAKVSVESKEAYRKCVSAASSLGSTTVQKVDLASSTKLLLGGQIPAQYDPALQNKRVKRDIVRNEKLKKHPAGLGLEGAFKLYLEDLKKPSSDRYIHSWLTTDDGGILIFTFVPSLLNLVHNVKAFEADVTFKRCLDLNEWEMVVFYSPLNRAITIGRVYINKADTNHYFRLFEEVRRLAIVLTGKPILFKRLSHGGNLLAMLGDMETPHFLGAGKSFLPTNDPEYSGIHVATAEELLAYIAKLCMTHGKRAILDFKPLLENSADYDRILDFVYIASNEELEQFTKFIGTLKVKKINDWWKHKLDNKWIMPCLLRSQSCMRPEDWDTTPATTNMGEGQHHWTNKQSGIRLPIVEAIESAREIDLRVAEEVKASFRMGIIMHNQSDQYHRMSRNSQRHNNTARKARESEQRQVVGVDLHSQIEQEKENRRQSIAKQRAMQDELKQLSGKPVSTVSRLRAPPVEASSCGRVKNVSGSRQQRAMVGTGPSTLPTAADVNIQQPAQPAMSIVPRASSPASRSVILPGNSILDLSVSLQPDPLLLEPVASLTTSDPIISSPAFDSLTNLLNSDLFDTCFSDGLGDLRIQDNGSANTSFGSNDGIDFNFDAWTDLGYYDLPVLPPLSSPPPLSNDVPCPAEGVHHPFDIVDPPSVSVRKRGRASEVDERDILPEGSRRPKRKSTRLLQLEEDK